MAGVRIGDRVVGPGSPCFITFEAGPTHNGLASAKRLIDHAAASGGDAVKFQILDPKRLMADKKVAISYGVLGADGAEETISEPLYDILARRAMSDDEWREAKAHADARGIAFFATVGFPEEVELVASMNCASIKIASADVNHFPLIRQSARTGLTIQLDTGNATIGEVEAAVDLIRAEGNENIIIHHCPSGYPARLDGINLNIITTLKRMFPYPIAFSDHTPGWEMDVAALALGVNLLEKSITEDRKTRSVEHIFSLEPADIKNFIRVVREVEQALGTNRRLMHQEERKRRLVGRRSAHAGKAAKAGTRIRDMAVEFRRPGDGISPDIYETLLDARLVRDVPAEHKLRLSDVSWVADS